MRADHTIATAHGRAESQTFYGCCEPCAADAHTGPASHRGDGVGGRSQIGAVT
jgi:hypothetical protein